MSLEALTTAIQRKAALNPALGYRVKFDLGEDGKIYWDGTVSPPTIDNSDGEADTTITITADNLDGLMNGRLSPTLAYMTGKLKVEGSLGVAMKINQLLED